MSEREFHFSAGAPACFGPDCPDRWGRVADRITQLSAQREQAARTRAPQAPPQRAAAAPRPAPQPSPRALYEARKAEFFARQEGRAPAPDPTPNGSPRALYERRKAEFFARQAREEAARSEQFRRLAHVL
ncbi:MAG: hypothetical protein JXM75_10900 [Chromatiaceae bacterium]|nr:hypothetical protein [Chromatiaceae bacterium]